MNTSRINLKKFLSGAAKKSTAEALILDAGAGNGLYKSLFSHTNYSSTDIRIQANNTISFVSDLSSIPIIANHYNLIICTQVLEHVSNPQLVLKELFRVLKPNGELWLSAPFYYEEHEIPQDYYRFTKFGLTHLFETAGFKVSEITPLEGYFMTLAYQLKIASQALPTNPQYYEENLMGFLLPLIMVPIKFLFLLLSALFSKLDIQYRDTSIGHPKNYAIIGIKPRESLNNNSHP